ncbi:hypothetical protein V492_04962 [Pseudogymnoascus sp. VKM F-4246]|nr:hypothetical protein V492_04962 [Pseudogymnoascus sp. VKM F-4246]
MSPKPGSSSTPDPKSAASLVTLEIEAARNCIGRLYKFKPYSKWSLDTQHEIHRDRLYQQHPVVVIHRQSDGHVHILTITSSIDKTVDRRMYMPVSGNHWDTSETREKVNLESTQAGACEMPKPQSYVRLDSRRQVPFEVLQESHGHSGENYQVSLESAIKLWDSVMEAERGFVSQQKFEYQNAERMVSQAVSGYIDRWTSVEQGEKQIRMLHLLQNRVKILARVIDDCLDQHWLQPQQELERSLFEQERTLQNAVRGQLGYQSQNQGGDNLFQKAAEAEAARRVETEIAISEMRDQNNRAGKCTTAQNKKLKKAVQKLIREEIRRGQGEGEGIGDEVKTTKGKKTAKLSKKSRKALKAENQPRDREAVESTLMEAGYGLIEIGLFR